MWIFHAGGGIRLWSVKASLSRIASNHRGSTKLVVSSFIVSSSCSMAVLLPSPSILSCRPLSFLPPRLILFLPRFHIQLRMPFSFPKSAGLFRVSPFSHPLTYPLCAREPYNQICWSGRAAGALRFVRAIIAVRATIALREKLLMPWICVGVFSIVPTMQL